MMKIINLTKNDVRLVNSKGFIDVLPASKTPVTIQFESVEDKTESDNDICLKEVQIHGINNLPDPEENTIYIVSTLVAAMAKHRKDLYIVYKPVKTIYDEIAYECLVSLVDKEIAFEEYEIKFIEKTLSEARYFSKDVRQYLFEAEKQRRLTEEEKTLYDSTHDVHIHTNDAGIILQKYDTIETINF